MAFVLFPLPNCILQQTPSNMLQRILALAVLGLVGLSIPAQAQQVLPLRVGYTDHELIIANMPEYRNVQQQLQEEYQSSQQVLQTMAQDFQGKVDRYQKQQALLSDERRQERETELAQAQQEIQQKASDAEQQLAQREAELLSPIFERVDKAIKEVAQEHKLDLVLRIQAGPMQPIILYANEDRVIDITRDVAGKLGLPIEGDGPTSSN